MYAQFFIVKKFKFLTENKCGALECLYTLLYKVPSKSTGKNFVLLLPVEFITKYFLKYLTPDIEVIYYLNYSFLYCG